MDRIIESAIATLGPNEAKAWEGPPAEYVIHFYHTDHLGSTRVITDEDGAIYETTNYLPFGEIATDNSAGTQDRIKFTGQMWDPLTNLYYYGARYYDPEIGRFTQADTVVPEPSDSQTFNRYSYAYNNPYKYTDPSGHIGILAAIVIAIVVSAIVDAVAVAVAAYLITSAILSAIYKQNMFSWEGAGGSVAGGLLALIPGVREVMLAYSMIQLAQAVHSGQGGQALIGIICGLVGNHVARYTYMHFGSSGISASAGASSTKSKNFEESSYTDWDLSEIPKGSNTLQVIVEQNSKELTNAIASRVEEWSRESNADVERVANPEDLADFLSSSKKKYDAIVFHGTGKPGVVTSTGTNQWSEAGFLKTYFHPTRLDRTAISSDFYAVLKEHLSPHASIYLVTCESGQGDLGLGFMLEIAQQTGARVIAPTAPVHSLYNKSTGSEILGPYMFGDWRVVSIKAQ